MLGVAVTMTLDIAPALQLRTSRRKSCFFQTLENSTFFFPILGKTEVAIPDKGRM